MNNKMVRYVIGHILKLETAFMLIPLALSFFYHESFIVKKSYFYHNIAFDFQSSYF